MTVMIIAFKAMTLLGAMQMATFVITLGFENTVDATLKQDAILKTLQVQYLEVS